MLRALSVCLVAALAISAAAAAPKRPNVLLVTLDTTRADRIGCYGHARAATPVLDRLAREGTRFSRAFSPVPLTLPAHASLFTGQLPREHGVRHNALFRLPSGAPTVATQLRAAGYRTAAVVAADVLDRSTGIDAGFSFFDGQVRVGPREWFGWEERGASQVVDAALAALPRLPEPFFLWVHFFDPHFPYVPPEPHRTRFAADLYDGEIAFVDAQLGRLLDAMKARGLADRTLVAVAGDHGESLGEHGERNHGVFVYQSTQHVPLILRGPGVPAGRVIAESCTLQDLGPTLVEFAGAKPLPRSAARSLVPALGGSKLSAQDIELETHYTRLAFGWAPLRALVRWPFKFVLAPRPELYDLASDPAERTDLAAARAELAGDLRRALAARLGAEYEKPPAGGTGPLDPEQVERLRSLGYAAPGGAAATAYAAIDPKDAIGWLVELDRARALMQAGSPLEALRALEPIVAKNPENLEATLSLVTATLGAGQPSRAVERARAAVQRWPENHLTHFNLANALSPFTSRDDAAAREAETEYRAALAIFPTHPESVHGLSGLLVERGRTADARTVLADAARRGLVDPDLALRRGVIEAALGNLDAADAAFGEAADLDPTSGRPHEARGKLAFQRGDARAAAGHYRRALELAPSAALARTLGAILLNGLDDRAGARAAFRRALELEPKGPAADETRALLEEIR